MKKPVTHLELGKDSQTAEKPEEKGDAKTGPTAKWSAVSHVRLPHKIGLPLGSGGCCDQVGH